MGDRFYPPLPEGFVYAAKIIAGNCRQDTDYLGEECPWSPDVIEGVKAAFVSVGASTPATAVLDPCSLDLGMEAMNLYAELSKLEAETGKFDVKDRIQVAKARAALLEKLLSLQEKATNIRSIREFQETIVQFMEQVLTEDQRLDFLTRVRGLPEENENE